MGVYNRGNKKYLAVLLFMFLFFLTFDSMVCSEELEPRKFSRSTLRGIKGISVEIDSLPEEVEKSGLTRDQIKTDTESKLRMASIKMVSEEESSLLPGNPYLYVNVTALKTYGLVSFILQVSLGQEVSLVRDPKIKLKTSTWEINKRAVAQIIVA
jgi:hypothetical protein